jgi:hypothetical protein
MWSWECVIIKPINYVRERNILGNHEVDHLYFSDHTSEGVATNWYGNNTRLAPRTTRSLWVCRPIGPTDAETIGHLSRGELTAEGAPRIDVTWLSGLRWFGSWGIACSSAICKQSSPRTRAKKQVKLILGTSRLGITWPRFCLLRKYPIAVLVLSIRKLVPKLMDICRFTTLDH